MRDLILASKSPWRAAILKGAGLAVRCVPSGVDETAVRAESPDELVRELARRKACAVYANAPDAIVLGADQVAWDPQSGIQGKPRSPTAHLDALLRMRGGWHDLVTGFHLVGPEFEHAEVVRTRMYVRADLTEAEIAAYVATGEGSGCAGGYAAEGRGGFLFERVDGDWFNVLGLPLFRVLTALRAHGWRFS